MGIPLQTWLTWGAVTCACILLISRILVPKLLELRGVSMYRTFFGVTLVFDSEDLDKTPVRLLNVDGTYQSASYISPKLRHELACEYHRSFVSELQTARVFGRSQDEEPARILVLGGGGFALPRFLVTHDSQIEVTVVEIDPHIIEIARTSFFLDEVLAKHGEEGDGRLQVIEADAWDVLADSGTWDAIINDAFSGKTPLGRIGTEHGAEVVAEHLAPGGVYLANVRCPLEGRKSRPLEEVKRAFAKLFATTKVVPEWPDEPKRAGNNAFIALGSGTGTSKL